MLASHETAVLNPGLLSWSHGGSEEASGDPQAANVTIKPASLLSSSSPLLRQPAQFNFNMQMLFHLSQGYYLSKLHEQRLRVPAIDYSVGSGSSNYRSSSSNNRAFWDKVKNGFYWLNRGSASLA